MDLPPIPERLFRDLESRGDCLLVTSYTPMVKGYVRLSIRRRLIMSHRLLVMHKLGRELLAQETVDHACHNTDPTCPGGNACWHRRCVNIEHLEVLDPIENWRRGRQGAPAMWRAKTHCPQGHPYEGANVGPASKKGGRACRACARARQAGRDPLLEPVWI